MTTAASDYLREPAAIYARSFAIIEAEAGPALGALPAALRPLARRLIHASGMTDIASDLAWSGAVVEAATAALDAGRPILVDVTMVEAGIIESRLPAGVAVRCTLGDPAVPGLAERLGTTRSAAAVELWRPLLPDAVVVIGNAPTALFHLLDRLRDWPERPAAILAFPVGFVGAVEFEGSLDRSWARHPLLDAARPARRQCDGRRRRQRASGQARLTGHWLDVIGIGADGAASLGAPLLKLIGEAHLVVGGARHLKLVADLAQGEAVPWSSPIQTTMQRLKAQRGRPPAVVLASGDPLWFGIGRLLLEHFQPHELAFHPHISAFQLAAARLAWPLAETACISLHGRALDRLNRHLSPGRRLLILTNDGAAPALIGDRLSRAGFGRSSLTVMENLGGTGETAINFPASEASHRRFGDLNTLAVVLEPDDAGAARPAASLAQGLADDAFIHDGQMTKQEVRAVTMARLAPEPGQHLWDIGAGAGSIAIEWLLAGRAAPDRPTTAVALEASADRVAVIIENAHRLGVPELRVIEGKAPAVLPDGPNPDAVFIGGGVAAPMLIEACLDHLTLGGRLVVNAVTLGGEARLLELQRQHGGTLSRIAISHAESLGRQAVGAPVGWKSMVPVTQWVLTRTTGAQLA